MSRLAFALAAGCIAAITLGAPAIAQNYPSKPVTLITPAAAGGSPDVILRILADRLERCNWNQTEAAEFLKIPLSTLNQKIKRLNVEIKKRSRE